MPYNLIKPPFTLKFREMSKRELKDYFQWFREIAPERLGQLVSAVNDSKSLAGVWQPDLTPASLESLGNWFATQIEVRPRGQHELEEIVSRSTFPIDVSDQELTTRTFSLAVDVGMYFAEALLKNYPLLRWEQPLDNKKFADYGQPVLVGFGPVPLNPVRIAVTLAYGVATRKQTGGRLREIYDYWSSRARSA